MSKPVIALIVASLMTGAALLTAWAEDPKPDPRIEVARKLPGNVKPEELTATSIPGIYEMQRGMEIGYVTSDGHYFFSGELHDLKTNANLTEIRRGEVRRKLLAAIPEKDMLVFGPTSSVHTITVFTDVDCGYCRKLHADIQQLNQLGIRVRYLFYPRAGPGSESWRRTESVWCSPNRKEALERAVNGERIQAPKCDAGLIARHYELGQTLGIQGTPGIFTANGGYLPGYLPPVQMLARVQQVSAKK